MANLDYTIDSSGNITPTAEETEPKGNTIKFSNSGSSDASVTVSSSGINPDATLFGNGSFTVKGGKTNTQTIKPSAVDGRTYTIEATVPGDITMSKTNGTIKVPSSDED